MGHTLDYGVGNMFWPSKHSQDGRERVHQSVQLDPQYQNFVFVGICLHHDDGGQALVV
jgi:hypothetical protein